MLRAKIGKGIVIVLAFLLAFVLIFLPANFLTQGDRCKQYPLSFNPEFV